MVKLNACCRPLTLTAVFAAGLMAGIGVQSWCIGQSAASACVLQTGPGAEEQVRKLKLELPPVSTPSNTLVNAVRVGDLLFVSGTTPGDVDGKAVRGRLGMDLDVKAGRRAARQVGLQILSVVKAELGSLDRIQRVVRTFGMVNAGPDFKQHPQVINGFSDLMVEVFGPEAGKGARCAVGMSSLPGGAPVEVEAVFQVRKEG